MCQHKHTEYLDLDNTLEGVCLDCAEVISSEDMQTLFNQMHEALNDGPNLSEMDFDPEQCSSHPFARQTPSSRRSA